MVRYRIRLTAILLILSVLFAVSCDNTVHFDGAEVHDASELKEALEKGGKIRLLADIGLDETLTVDKDTIIYLNGKTITGNAMRVFNLIGGRLELAETGTVQVVGEINPASSVIRVGFNPEGEVEEPAEAVLEVGSGATVIGPCYGISVFGKGTKETVVINGTVISSKASAISGNGSAGYGGTKITVGEGARISGAEAGIYQPQAGVLTINGGVIEGKTGIEIKAGTVVIKGGEIKATEKTPSHAVNSNGPSTAGYAAAVVENAVYAGNAVLSISGGIFYGPVEKLTDSAKAESEYSIKYTDQSSIEYVASPENVNEIVNSINTGIVRLSAGEYGDISITHGRSVSTAKTREGNPIAIDELSDDAVYSYYRTISDLTIKADKGAVIKGKLSAGSGHCYGTADNQIVDPIRNIVIASTNNSYYSYITISNSSFEGLVIDGGNIEFGYSLQDSSINGLSIKDCRLTKANRAADDKAQAIRFQTDLNGIYNDISITGCTIDGYYQGVYIQDAKNAEISGNRIANGGHNLIAIQSGGGDSVFSGSIVISSNDLEKTSDRAIRFGNGNGASITVAGNRISDASDEDGEVLKTGALTDCTFSFTGNTYNGVSLADVTDGTDDAYTITASK